MKIWLMVFITLFCAQRAVANSAAAFDHSAWDALLKQHVYLLEGGQASQVDYQGFADDQPRLAGYLKSLSQVSVFAFDSWPKQDQLAFLINAYNAWTVDLILQKWPDLESIKDLGGWFRSPWSKAFIPLLGQIRSLDDIEHQLIRGSGRYQEPRIHFAVNCASIGCPALANYAYRGDNLDRALDSQTRLFLADRSRNRFSRGRLEVSAIFKWYRKDFEKGWQGYFSLNDFLFHYAADLSLSLEAAHALTAKQLQIDFLDYDWALNARPEKAGVQ